MLSCVLQYTLDLPATHKLSASAHDDFSHVAMMASKPVDGVFMTNISGRNLHALWYPETFEERASLLQRVVLLSQHCYKLIVVNPAIIVQVILSDHVSSISTGSTTQGLQSFLNFIWCDEATVICVKVLERLYVKHMPLLALPTQSSRHSMV